MSAAVSASSGLSAPPRSRASVRQTWSDRLQRFASAGLSVTAFCRSEGLSSQAFYYWKQKLAAAAPTPAAKQPRLLPVRLLAAASPVPVELVLPQGAVLRLAPGCDLAFVPSLVLTQGDAPC